jgi:hypothetical protein
MRSWDANLGFPASRFPRLWRHLEEILENYPQLKREDVLAAIAYGAEMSRERYVDLPGSTAA